MERTFSSTKGETGLSFESCVLRGFSPLGGLIMPGAYPVLDRNFFESIRGRSYGEIVAHVLSLFIDESEMTHADLSRCVETALKDFDDQNPGIVDLGELDHKLSLRVLELFNCPTFAFKDFGMHILASIICDHFLVRRGGTISLAAATSGDTGSSALKAFFGKKNASITVLFPEGAISDIQRIQTVTVASASVTNPGDTPVFDNTACYAVSDSSSDDLDRILFGLFGDEKLVSECSLGSVNSFNIGRILVQAANFVYAYAKMYEEICNDSNMKTTDNTAEHDNRLPRIAFVIPTGAFGNAVSADIARRCGIPFEIVIANNINDPAHRLIRSGKVNIFVNPANDCVDENNISSGDKCSGGPRVIKSIAPAIDIGVPYNIERYLHSLASEVVDGTGEGDAAELTQTWMAGFSSRQGLKLPLVARELIKRDFLSASSNDAETKDTLKRIYSKRKYILDTHTSVAASAAMKLTVDIANRLQDQDKKFVILVGTASPFKFRDIIEKLGITLGKFDSIDNLWSMEDSSIPINQETLGDSETTKIVAQKIRQLHNQTHERMTQK